VSASDGSDDDEEEERGGAEILRRLTLVAHFGAIYKGYNTRGSDGRTWIWKQKKNRNCRGLWSSGLSLVKQKQQQQQPTPPR